MNCSGKSRLRSHSWRFVVFGAGMAAVGCGTQIQSAGCRPDPHSQQLSNALDDVISGDPVESASRLKDAINGVFNAMNENDAVSTIDQLLSDTVSTPDALGRLVTAIGEFEKEPPSRIKRSDKSIAYPTVILHINGIFVGPGSLQDNDASLRARVAEAFDGGIGFDPFFNDRQLNINACTRVTVSDRLPKFLSRVRQIPQHCDDSLGTNCVNDLPAATASQLKDRIQQWLDLNYRVILVPHSHGNCLLKQAMVYFGPDDGTANSPFNSIGIIMVASPICIDEMPGRREFKYSVHACGDPIACLACLGNSACQEATPPCDASGLSCIRGLCIFPSSILHHSFVKTYLNQTSPRQHIMQSLANLDRDLSAPTPACASIPSTWIQCGCPNYHPCYGIVCNGVRYHQSGLSCDPTSCQ